MSTCACPAFGHNIYVYNVLLERLQNLVWKVCLYIHMYHLWHKFYCEPRVIGSSTTHCFPLENHHLPLLSAVLVMVFTHSTTYMDVLTN